MLYRKTWQPTISRSLVFLSALAIVLNVFLPSAFFIEIPLLEIPVAQAADGNMCQVPVDVVLVMDTSGSMAEGENPTRCEWWELKWFPDEQTNKWVKNITNNVTQSWCEAKKPSSPPLPPADPIFYPAIQSKINSAKSAANSFLNNLGASDQSGLVSFADAAILKKSLSDDRAATQSAVNSLATGGSTNIGEAIHFAIEQFNSNGNGQAVKAMILLTDGKANKPSTVTDPELYAEQKATEAAALGYKIFTIGLGSNSDINEALLQNIANETSAQYYHANNGNDLSVIYDQIAYQVCQYASISGCKWHDTNADGIWQGTENELLEAWEIQLLDEAQNIQTQPTDEWGCYQFSGLTPGNYHVREVEQPGWVQTYPTAPNYHAITISGTEKVENIHFGNYQPQCGNNIIDSNFGEACEIGNSQSCITGEDYSGTRSCDSTCVSWGACVTPEMCGDGIKNGSEECDGAYGLPDEHHICTSSCTLEYVPYCGDEIINQATENCDGDADRVCEFSGYTGAQSCSQCTWGTCQTTDSCGDGIINGQEMCDGDTSQGCATAEGYNGTQSCNVGCDGWDTCATTESCGDNVKNGNEECDDGNLIDGDSCSATCQLEQNQPAPICGNNIIESGEQCDDGNTTNGDSCSSICETETSGPVCGDNNLDQGEQCDDGNTTDGDGCDNTCQTEQPAGIQQGDIVINEIMQNPKKSSDLSGEWFEVYNITNHNIDLNNCVIADSGSNYHIINSSLIVSPHGYAVLGKNNNQTTNGGVDVNYQYSSFVLNNSSDEIILACDGTEIDRVEYDGGPNFPNPDGKSMILASPYLDNNIGSNWCLSSSSFGLGDLGTPGTHNDQCAGFTGSLTIYKYSDLDGNISTTADQELAATTIWTFFAVNNQMSYATTTLAGAAVFKELPVGEYAVSEQQQAGWYLVGTAPHSQSVAVNAGQNSPINFYNTEYSSISGYKYEDLDGVTSTVSDLVGRAGWTINLFKDATTTAAVATTTTDSFGHFAFGNLLPGNYYLTETMAQNWQQVSAPTTTIVLVSGTNSQNNNFINYFQGGQGGEPEPEPSSSVLPSAGGGGGFTARPSAALSAVYPKEKELGKEVLETLVVSNDGNIILTNGVLTLDLNQEKLRLENAFPIWDSFDQTEQKAVWRIDALAVSGEQSINLTIMPLANGLVETSSAVVFDQVEDSLIYSEIINPSSFGVGGEGPGAGEGGGEVSPPLPTGLPTGGQNEGGETTAGPTEEQGEKEIVVAGEKSAQGPEIVVTGGAGAVEGVTVQACPVCPWWLWLLAVILHLWTISAYSFIIKWQASKKGAQGELPFILPFPWLWLSLVAISLVVIYILFLTICNFPPLILALPFLSYLAVLAAYHFIVSQKKQGLWSFVPLLVAIGPIVVYLFSGVWAWWIWLLVLGLYILSIIFYHNAIFKEPNSHTWWWTILFLTLLVLVLEIAIARHLPCR